MFRSLMFSCLLVVHSMANAQVVAVLEHPQCQEVANRVVRPLFKFGPNGWVSLSDGADISAYKSDWFVVGTGGRDRVLVKLPVVMPEPDWPQDRDFFLQPNDASVLPVSPNPLQRYGGWCDPPANKPILLLSEDQAMVDSSILSGGKSVPKKAIHEAFQKSLSRIKLCTLSETPRPTKLRLSDTVVQQDLSFADGTRLIGVGLRRPMDECGGDRGDGVSEPRWFVVGKKMRFIGASLDYIQSGDFNGDGQLEHIFWSSGYNRDGYVMFDSRSMKRTQFIWSYH